MIIQCIGWRRTQGKAIDWLIDFKDVNSSRLFYAYRLEKFHTQLYDIKYSYLIEIICTQLYGFKYSCLI